MINEISLQKKKKKTSLLAVYITYLTGNSKSRSHRFLYSRKEIRTNGFSLKKRTNGNGDLFFFE
ncbi:hypothetical protein Syun_005812 [Stephania yunnanensis]|uniref:Uncharacterized protein n=1 Tax=Stephania yunnanensis TaxID=152371 RepID=A0AAP0KVG1_9MAGN